MHTLTPFGGPSVGFSVSGSLSFTGGLLRVSFELRDPRHEVQAAFGSGARIATACERADDLWRATCFEAFFGEPGKPGYWELNLAPDGRRWNLYSFDGYRVPQPPRRSSEFSLAGITAGSGSLSCELRAEVPVGPLEASLTAVALTATGPVYCAVKHAGPKADFHLRESFVLRVG